MSNIEGPYSGLDQTNPAALPERPHGRSVSRTLKYISLLVLCVVIGQGSRNTQFQSVPSTSSPVPSRAPEPLDAPEPLPLPESEDLEPFPQYLDLLEQALQELPDNPQKTALLDQLNGVQSAYQLLQAAEMALGRCRTHELGSTSSHHGRLQMAWTRTLRESREQFDRELLSFLQGLDIERMQAGFQIIEINPRWTVDRQLEALRSRYCRQTILLAICQIRLQNGQDTGTELAELIHYRRHTRGLIDVLSIQHALQREHFAGLPDFPPQETPAVDSPPKSTTQGPRWF